MIESKNAKLSESFTKYCLEHPEQRFWQALRNWSGYNYIYAQNENVHLDTFYIE